MTPDGNIHIQSDIPVYHTKRNRVWRTIFIADDILDVHKVNSLVCCRISAKSETHAELSETVFNALAQTAVENGWLRRCIIQKLTCLRTDINYLSLIHNQCALSFIYRNNGAVGDHIIVSLCIAAAFSVSFSALYDQHVRIHGITVEILSPFICQYTFCRR